MTVFLPPEDVVCGPVVLRVLVGVVAAVPGGEVLVPQPGPAPQPVALLELRRRVHPPLKAKSNGFMNYSSSYSVH